MRKLLILIVFLLLISSVSAQGTFHHFFGKVEGFDGSLVAAQVGEQEYRTQVVDGQYGYDPAFKVEGDVGDEIQFFVGTQQVTTATLESEGLTNVDLIHPSTTTAEAEPVIAEETSEPQEPVPTREPTRSFQPPPEAVSAPPTLLITVGIIVFLIVAGILMYFAYHLHSMRRMEPKDPKLVGYIQSMMQRGYTKDYIEKYLEKFGWEEKKIKAVLRTVKAQR